MEEGQKKVVMIVIVIACLAAAGIITYVTRSGEGGIRRFAAGEITQLKCNNPDCGHEFEMDQADYLEYLKEHAVPGMSVPPIPCPQCGEDSCFRAIKCEKCGKVFFPNTVEARFEDKCPDCGYSELEERRAQRTGQ